MKISFRWLCSFLPFEVTPDEISVVLTKIGLEVEALESYQTLPGDLSKVLVGEVIECTKHPNADKLKQTKVNVGQSVLNIVCGAPNVAQGQKVMVATIGANLHSFSGKQILIQRAVIRGAESFGMLCAEDELGLSNNHDGILVLPHDTAIGITAEAYFEVYTDHIFEINLTPNRVDAMSHLGVAKDLCAYYSLHKNQPYTCVSPQTKTPLTSLSNKSLGQNFKITIAKNELCTRYCLALINQVKVQPSPKWLQDKLLCIGQKPVNNVVDVTNWVLFTMGQPLHAFDVTAFGSNEVIIDTLLQGTIFTGLDNKKRTLTAQDIVICNAQREPLCLAGMIGGLDSGVSYKTTTIILESACFNKHYIRKSSLHHQLRTESAIRFEKGVDPTQSLTALEYATQLILELTGGSICSIGHQGALFADWYPVVSLPKKIVVSYDYINKLSGKQYDPILISKLLHSLGFNCTESTNAVTVMVPAIYDMNYPADIVEEIIRIDGIDAIPMATTITINPQLNRYADQLTSLRHKMAEALVSWGFFEIYTNSITHRDYYPNDLQKIMIPLLNTVNSELDVLRPSLIETGIETIAYNLNRQLKSLQLFEFGKVYQKQGNHYIERMELGIFLTGTKNEGAWHVKERPFDFFDLKSIVTHLIQFTGAPTVHVSKQGESNWCLSVNNKAIGSIGYVDSDKLNRHGIKQSVLFAVIDLSLIEIPSNQIVFQEIPKFPFVQRDLALVVKKDIPYQKIDDAIRQLAIPILNKWTVFDVFESEKIGKDLKSIALRFWFIDAQKNLVDQEVDREIASIVNCLEKLLNIVIRTN